MAGGSLKNWTSTVEAEQSMALIRKVLTAHKAKKIQFEKEKYGSRKMALRFELVVGTHLLQFCLRAELERVERLVSESYRGHYRKGHPTIVVQAYRTAWANLREFVQVALALVDSGCAVMEQVFFPYLILPDAEDEHDERTTFEHFRAQLLLPSPGKEEDGPVRGQYVVIEEKKEEP
jgi:hypothetical protein